MLWLNCVWVLFITAFAFVFAVCFEWNNRYQYQLCHFIYGIDTIDGIYCERQKEAAKERQSRTTRKKNWNKIRPQQRIRKEEYGKKKEKKNDGENVSIRFATDAETGRKT